TTNVTTNRNRSTGFLSPKAAIIFEPTPNQTYYASYARSSTPAGMYVTNANAALGANDPTTLETANSYEIGAKVDFLDGRLGLTGAVSDVPTNKAIYTDPRTGDTTFTGDWSTSRGVELGLSGSPTEAWTISLAYAFNDARFTASSTAGNVGNLAPFASPHAA